MTPLAKKVFELFGKPELAAELVNPAFLAVHPNQRFLYVATEDPLSLGPDFDHNLVRLQLCDGIRGWTGIDARLARTRAGSTCFDRVQCCARAYAQKRNRPLVAPPHRRFVVLLQSRL